MFEYARLLGWGETPDRIGTYTYSSLAAVRGIPAAGDCLDTLEAQMTAEEVLAAQQAAKAWAPTKIVAAGAAPSPGQ
jgi:hypothetical protein